MRLDTQPSIISRQVSDSRYYYLNMNPLQSREIVIVCGGVERCNPDYVIRRNTFEYFGLEFVAEGKGKLLLNNKEYALVPGMIFSYGPGIPCQIYNNPDSPMLKYFIDFVGTDAEKLLMRSPVGIGGTMHLMTGVTISELFENMLSEGVRDSAFTKELTAAIFNVLMLKIAESALAGNPETIAAFESFTRCKETIDRHFLTYHALNDIANAAHLDAAYICRLFKKFHRSTPYAYLTRQKMRYAADLLASSRKIIKQVAEEVGYDDAYHFSRVFKSVHGVSPRRFLELSRRG